VTDSPPARLGRLAGAIHTLPIPTPFLVGRVNCYLIDDDPLTLLDTGPNSGKALDELEQALAARGRRIEDLERIVLSHQHIDHLGLAGILRRRSGAEVCALDVLAPVVEGFRDHAERDDELAEALMLRHGIPRDVVAALRSVSVAYRAWGGTSQVDVPRVGQYPEQMIDRPERIELVDDVRYLLGPIQPHRQRTRIRGLQARAFGLAACEDDAITLSRPGLLRGFGHGLP